MSKRVFVAIPAAPTIHQNVLAWQKAHSDLPVNWVKEKNLHFTLVPPWYVSDETELIEKLKNNQQLLSLQTGEKIELTRIILGPNEEDPHTIWAEGHTPKSLPSLISTLDKILERSSEEREFRLHITMARFRKKQFENFPTKTLNEQIHWEQPIDSIVLMQSHLGSEQADYEILTKIYL